MTIEKEKSVVIKILSIFWQPSVTFNSLKIKSSWHDIVIPFLPVSIVTMTSLPFIIPISLAEQREMVAKSERFTDEQKELPLERIENQKVSIIQ